ncbi:MAG: hypothetical protein A2V88_07945 [Elusimicrobia bacterium RBG_16_66_12]|nr:MAG: hypothetical protein A2V88_07945 [Elusimicrobia bacterium RBG_16_66_12]
MNINASTLLLLAMVGLCSADCSAALTSGESAVLYDSYAAERKGDLDTALSRMMILLPAHQDDYLINYRLGWLFSRGQKYKNAIAHYTRAAQVAPASVEPWLALSLLHLNLGYHRLALEASNELLKRDPKNYYGLLRLAAAQQAQKMNEAALAATDKGLELYPMDALFLEKKGYLLKALGRSKESDQTLEQLLILNPQNAYAKWALKK